MEEKIIEKIQKLLALAESSNQHEAEVAMAKAQELMTKHNIEMQSIKDHDSEYVSEKTAEYSKEDVESKFVNPILTAHFFVQIVKSKRCGSSYLNFVGEKNNVKTAIHMKTYLTNVFSDLWKQYKKENNAPMSAKQSFYLGLYRGFDSKMSEQRKATEQQYGLVLVTDPKIKEKMNEMFHNLKSGKSRSINSNDSSAKDAGYSQGRNLNVNSGAISA